jgi:hypothetical protein
LNHSNIEVTAIAKKKGPLQQTKPASLQNIKADQGAAAVADSPSTTLAFPSRARLGKWTKPFVKFEWSNWLLLLIVSALPVALSQKLWLEVWRGGRPHAWDGTGHFAIAQIYDQTIFPDTFGWTHAYFGGMPFPNFYPPVFYWLVGLLHHTPLFSFNTAFKIMVALPVLLMPAAVWLLARAVSDHSRLAASGAALASIALMVDSRFLPFFPSGLDYFSTFQIGLYTQPLGFVLLIVWYAVYVRIGERRWLFTASCLLLALTVLTNFFNAITAMLFMAASLTTDWIRLRRATTADAKAQEQRTLVAHLSTPVIAFGLTLFWVVPMFSRYDYFVTRPYIIEFSKLISPALIGWYVLAVAGSIIWTRRPSRAIWPYLAICILLALGILFAGTIAPRWFPLQSSRFLATLNFLLAVPVGQLLAFVFRAFAKLLGEISKREQPFSVKQVRYTAGTAIVLLALLALTSPGPRPALAFYPHAEPPDVSSVLEFARQHRDGRYLVEVINPTDTTISFDARAINAYLGAQGNETLSAVFHEASTNVLFSLPVVNTFSQYPDSFGISSMLADDLDFATQPLAEHIKRAQLLSARYLVIHSPGMKSRLAQESMIGNHFDFGSWSIFELKGAVQPDVHVLSYRPALVVSDFTVKQRRSNELSFIRLVEEQMADGWFDVILARSSESKIDRIRDLDQFGSLILDTYDCADESRAFERLRDFAQRRAIILLSSDAALFQRIKSAIAEFPMAEIIERMPEPPGGWIDSIRPSFHYQESAIRKEWQSIRRALERRKVAISTPMQNLASRIDQNTITITSPASETEPVPVLIPTAYFPSWQRGDGESIYATTPFYMLTFVRESTQIVYGRRWSDWLAMMLSILTFLCLLSVGVLSKMRIRPRTPGKERMVV